MMLLPFLLSKTFESFFKRITSLNSTQTHSPTLQLPLYFYGLFALVALSLLLNGFYLWQRANHADQGAKGEEDVAKALKLLEREGWQFEYGMLLGDRLGDADIVWCLLAAKPMLLM